MTVLLAINRSFFLNRQAPEPFPAQGQNELFNLLAGGISWPGLFQAAIYHNVLPVLYQALATLPAGTLPAGDLAQLRQLYLTQALHHQGLLADLSEISDRFQSAGIPVMCIKGPAFSMKVYGNPILRQFMDVDILVHEGDYSPATTLLTELGYLPEGTLPGKELARYLRAHYHTRWSRAGKMLELHWAPGERGFIYPWKAAEWWAGAQWITFENQRIQVLADENALLLACLHGAGNHWSKLKWIMDVACLSQEAGINWERLLHFARGRGFLRLVGSGMRLAQRLVGVALPIELKQMLSGDATVDKLCETTYQAMMAGDKLENPAANARFYLQTRERLRDHLYYFFDQIFIPKHVDWATWPLPVTLFPLYYGLRPLRLVMKFLPYWIGRRRNVK